MPRSIELTDFLATERRQRIELHLSMLCDMALLVLVLGGGLIGMIGAGLWRMAG